MHNQQMPALAIHGFGSDATSTLINLPKKKRHFITHPPSWPDGHSDLECDLLERLDDIIFSAISGDIDALELARTMWPTVVAEHGWELVEESRAQYLRCAIDRMVQVESLESEMSEQVYAVSEVVALLTDR